MSIAIEEINRTNCKTYLLVKGHDAILVDPVRERFDTYRLLVTARGLRLRMVIETHTHADHLMLSRSAREALGAALVMHRESPSPHVDHHVDDGDVILLGDERIMVKHTPGHTPDSVCYYIPSAAPVLNGSALGGGGVKVGAVLTGDTLLIGGSGRTDFPGSDAGKQYDAVTGKLFTLPDETVVLPGHDYKGRTSSTIGAEKASNPRFSGKSREEYIALMGGLSLPFPEKVQQALQVNQSGFESAEVGFPLVSDIASMPALSAEELAARLHDGEPPILLDVREPEEFVGDLGHIEGSLLVPLDALERRLPKLAGYADRDVVVICRAGARSASAGAILRRAGFVRVYNLRGGMLAWASAGQPIKR